MVMLLLPSFVMGQLALERFVIGSTGGDASLSDGSNYSFTVGEVITTNLFGSDFDLTQGFQQPEGMVLDALSAAVESNSTICPDVNQGSVEVFPTGCLPPYSATLVSKFNPTDTLFIDEFTSSGATFDNLDSGTYILNVRGLTLCSYQEEVVVETKNDDCGIEFYSGISPNGDGFNDTWIIDNIELLQPNQVEVYSRWGTKVWSTSDYDNNKRVWSGQNNNGNDLPDGTYFYVIKTPGDEYSGWIQLTR